MALTQAERSRRFRERHPERAQASTRDYRRKVRAANPEGERAKGREYDRRRDRERLLARRAAWRKANREVLRAKARERYARDPNPALNSNAAYRAVRRANLAAATVEKVDRALVLAAHGAICGICGAPVDPADWHMDHIKPLARGGLHCYENVQPSHPVCNLSKGPRGR